MTRWWQCDTDDVDDDVMTNKKLSYETFIYLFFFWAIIFRWKENEHEMKPHKNQQ